MNKIVVLEDMEKEISETFFSLSFQEACNENSCCVSLELHFGKMFPVITRECKLSVYDLETLKEQIHAFLNHKEKKYTEISLCEPDFCMSCMPLSDHEVIFSVSIDAGVANQNMGTSICTGPSLRLLTNESNLKKWIEEISQCM